LLDSDTAIQPLLGGRNEEAVRLMDNLWARGLYVPAIRPPTVPQGTARLRISLSAAHTPEDIDTLLNALTRLAAPEGGEGGADECDARTDGPRARDEGGPLGRVAQGFLDLDGRAFLHEYRWAEDTTHAVLELILTAPMVVTNWINLQYHGSTVDPERFGSGDKVLHNVVGGTIGVFEGAGGDLRIGLAHQSVHDGTDWVHEPLRLSVFVEAPASMIDGIIEKHAVVRQLVVHEWLHLFRIDPVDGAIHRRARSTWELM
jgi:hypothetical protein